MLFARNETYAKSTKSKNIYGKLNTLAISYYLLCRITTRIVVWPITHIAHSSLRAESKRTQRTHAAGEHRFGRRRKDNRYVFCLLWNWILIIYLMLIGFCGIYISLLSLTRVFYLSLFLHLTRGCYYQRACDERRSAKLRSTSDHSLEQIIIKW